MQKYSNQILGRLGENISIKFLENLGYKIVEKNFRCRLGEIDIIAYDKEELVFIEVKTRDSFLYGKPIEAINDVKQNHIVKVAQYFLYKYKIENSFVRFDVIEVFKEDNMYKVNHIKQII